MSRIRDLYDDFHFRGGPYANTVQEVRLEKVKGGWIAPAGWCLPWPPSTLDHYSVPTNNRVERVADYRYIGNYTYVFMEIER